MRISKRSWGRHDGRDVFLFELETGGMRACVSNYGGILQALHVQNGHGEDVDAVLGYDTLEEYIRSETFFGAMVGPIADRLGEGRCVLDGEEVQLPLNAGPDCMHSGDRGFHSRVWDWEILPDGIAFVRSFAPGELGFPAALHVRLGYRITREGVLRIEYAATADLEMALSLTNHSYFTLNGGSGHCRDHALQIFADCYAETRRKSDPICTGRMLPVEGTPFDLRGGRRIEDVLACSGFSEIRTGGGIDHYFPVNGSGMRDHARLACPRCGLQLTCRSDAPGVLVYSANGLEAEAGKGGSIYGRNWAVCLETECFPNAVNMPHLRDQVIVTPGITFKSATEFVFESI